MDPQSSETGPPRTTRRGGLFVCLFGLALIVVDGGLILLFWQTHTRMFGVMYVPAAVGLLFFLAGLNAVVHPTSRRRTGDSDADGGG